MKHKFKLAIRLLGQFFQIGCFTFGGGWSIVAQMQKEYVEKQKVISQPELLDMTSVGRSLPGTMTGHIAFLFGYHMGGAICGIACVIGIAAPPLIILSVLTFCYTAFRDNIYIARAMTGVRATVVPIIGTAAVGLLKGAFRYRACILIALGSFILYFVFHVSCVVIVLVGAACGLALSEFQERKERAGHDSI